MRPQIRPEPLSAFQRASESLLRRLDELLAEAATASDVAWTLADFAGRSLDLDDCVVYLVDAGAGTISQRAAWGAKRVTERIFEHPIRLALGSGVVGTCAQLGRAQRVGDTREDPRYVVDDGKRLSELAVPIRDGDTIHGVIDSEHRDPHYYRPEHERALQAIADRGAARLRELAAGKNL